MAVGSTTKRDEGSYSLTKMQKRKRGKGKTGRKEPRKRDYDYDVNGAPDSLKVGKGIGSTHVEDMLDHSGEYFREDDPPAATSTPVCNKQSHTTKNQEECYNNEECVKQPKTEANTNDTNNVQEGCDYPWSNTNDVERESNSLVRALRTAKSYDDVRSSTIDTLSPGEWLNGEAIDQAILNFISEANLNPSILAFPVHIYQFVAWGRYSEYFNFVDRHQAMNKDILLFPINLDVNGPGTHWCLVVAMMKNRELYLFDSASRNSNMSGLIRLRILYLIGARLIRLPMSISITQNGE